MSPRFTDLASQCKLEIFSAALRQGTHIWRQPLVRVSRHRHINRGKEVG